MTASPQPTNPATEADAEHNRLRTQLRALADYSDAQHQRLEHVHSILDAAGVPMGTGNAAERVQRLALQARQMADEITTLRAENDRLRGGESARVGDALTTRAVSLLSRVLLLVDRTAFAWPDAQATVREAESFLVEQGVVVRDEPVVPDRLAYRGGKP